MTLAFEPPKQPVLPITGRDMMFPVRRIFCVGRNYAEHAAEMGNEVDRSAPFYFTKSAHHLVQSGSHLPYPPGTRDYHHEMELAVAIGGHGFNVRQDDAAALIFGYASALDMTRRDLQSAAKEKRRPWDIAKDVEGSAVVSAITPDAEVTGIEAARIWLNVGGERRQDASTADMIHNTSAIIAHLSGLYHLAPGDLILTGTPAGVGAVGPGDEIEGGIDGLEPVRLGLGDAELDDRAQQE